MNDFLSCAFTSTSIGLLLKLVSVPVAQTTKLSSVSPNAGRTQGAFSIRSCLCTLKTFLLYVKRVDTLYIFRPYPTRSDFPSGSQKQFLQFPHFCIVFIYRSCFRSEYALDLDIKSATIKILNKYFKEFQTLLLVRTDKEKEYVFYFVYSAKLMKQNNSRQVITSRLS